MDRDRPSVDLAHSTTVVTTAPSTPKVAVRMTTPSTGVVSGVGAVRSKSFSIQTNSTTISKPSNLHLLQQYSQPTITSPRTHSANGSRPTPFSLPHRGSLSAQRTRTPLISPTTQAMDKLTFEEFKPLDLGPSALEVKENVPQPSPPRHRLSIHRPDALLSNELLDDYSIEGINMTHIASADELTFHHEEVESGLCSPPKLRNTREREDDADRHSTPEPIRGSPSFRGSFSSTPTTMVTTHHLSRRSFSYQPQPPLLLGEDDFISTKSDVREALLLPPLPSLPSPPTFDLTDLLGFLHTPLPNTTRFCCTLQRHKSPSFSSKFYPRYTLSIEAGMDTNPPTLQPIMILYAQKKSSGRYLLHLGSFWVKDGNQLPKIKKTDPCYLGELRANFVGNKYAFHGRMTEMLTQKHSRQLLVPTTPSSQLGSSQPPTPSSDVPSLLTYPLTPSTSSPLVSSSPTADTPAFLLPEVGPPDAEIEYEINIFNRQPRHMVVTLPGIKSDLHHDHHDHDDQRVFMLPPSAATTTNPSTSKFDLDSLDSPPPPPILLHTNQPRWNSARNCHVLNFGGRALISSLKNFQLIPAERDQTTQQATTRSTLATPTTSKPTSSTSSQNGTPPSVEKVSPSSPPSMTPLPSLTSDSTTAGSSLLSSSSDPSAVVLQLGKKGVDEFNVDMRYPLTPVQGFAIILSAFDFKLAVD